MKEKTNNEISGLTVIVGMLKVLAVVIVFGLGVFLGRWQSKEWSVTDKHISLEAKGYHYCPYCGEEFER